jgi:hypothetical protein
MHHPHGIIYWYPALLFAPYVLIGGFYARRAVRQIFDRAATKGKYR